MSTVQMSTPSSPALRLDDERAHAFRQVVADWLAEVRPPSWDARRRGSFSYEEAIEERREWDDIVRDGGFAGISWPTDVGGKGLGLLEEFIFAEESAAAGAPDVLNFIGIDLAGPAIITHGNEEQRHRLLPAILDGSVLWCEGFSEPDAGSDMAAVATTADRVEGGWVVNGQKLWTSVADIADRCYLLVRTSRDLPKRKNLSVLLLDMHQPGVEVRPIRQANGDSEYSEVFLTDAFVDEKDLLGVENEGWALGSLGGFRQSRMVRDAMRRYVLIRAAMDELKRSAPSCPSSEVDQLEQEVQLLRSHVIRTAELIANERDATGPSSVMRLAWSELWQRIALQGSRHATAESAAYWRDHMLYTRSVTIAGGTSQIQRNVVANTILRMPR